MNAFSEQQNRLHVAEFIIAFTAVLFMTSLVGAIAWMQYGIDDPPFVSLKARMLDSAGNERYVYRAGEMVQIRRDFCAQKTIPVTVGRAMRNLEHETGIPLDSMSEMYKKGCQEAGNAFVIPLYAPPGKYAYVVTIRYPENVLRDSSVELPVVFFEVVK